MYVLSYLGDAFKIGVLLIGFNDSADKISIEKAYHKIEKRIKRLEQYSSNYHQGLINLAQRQIFRLSCQGEILASNVENVVDELEQQIVFEHPNKTIRLPKFLREIKGIYHLVANDQFCFSGGDVSCGYWTVINAKAINDYLEEYQEGRHLNVDLINRKACMLFKEYIKQGELYKLESSDINDNVAACTWLNLNSKTFSDLLEACQQNEEQAREICLNKLHVINLQERAGRQVVFPSCISHNSRVAKKEYDEIIREFISKLLTDGDSHQMKLIINVINASRHTEIVQEEQLEIAEIGISSIDWYFLKELIKSFDRDIQLKILSYAIEHSSCFIDTLNLKQKIGEKLIPENLQDLFNYKENNKLLTLVNLQLALCFDKQKRKIDRLSNGTISSYIYFKALADGFHELIDDEENGAFHFACHLQNHWILISVISRRGKPYIIIFDSTNSKIKDESFQVFYIQFLHQLLMTDNDNSDSFIEAQYNEECRVSSSEDCSILKSDFFDEAKGKEKEKIASD